MAVEAERLSPAEHLERRSARNLADAGRWRAGHGDPAAAMGAFLRAWIGPEGPEATYREYLRHEDSFVFDDDDDDDDTDDTGDEDGRESDRPFRG